MSPLTRATPKELLPINGRPMIRWCIEEALLSGIEEIGIVVNRDKKGIRDYLTGPEKTRSWGDERAFRESLKGCGLTFIDQPEPRGSGEAIRRGRAFVGSEPFAVMMPDFVLFESRPALRQMIEARGRRAESAIGFLQLDGRRAGMFGNVGILEAERIEGQIHRIRGLSAKKPEILDLKGETPVFKAVGRQILCSDFFAAFDTISWQGNEEMDDVPVIQRLIQEKRVLGIHIEGHGFDVGNRQGYEAANQYWDTQPLVPYALP
jgi:UTP--glucose-1-phosphate uridylyltransferase